MKVFIIPFRIHRMETSVMPANLSGAYVSCYSSGDDYTAAVKKSLARLKKDGLYPEEILQPIHEMNVKYWSQHILEKWPEQATSLPAQIEFESALKDGGVVYGPFGSYA